MLTAGYGTVRKGAGTRAVQGGRCAKQPEPVAPTVGQRSQRRTVLGAALTRRQAQSALDRLRRLRNAVAHHEPIFERHLWGDYKRILTVTGWISPEARAWIEQRSRVPGLLRTGIRASDVGLHWTKAQAA